MSKGQRGRQPDDAVRALFLATDERDWNGVKEVLCQTEEGVLLDYSSMNGKPPAQLTPEKIVEGWSAILPGFEHTHHQIGNITVNELSDHTAHVFCYGTATHYLPHAQGNVWTVVGTYLFTLTRSPQSAWTISEMKFNFKYQDGNTALPQLAQQRVKSGNDSS